MDGVEGVVAGDGAMLLLLLEDFEQGDIRNARSYVGKISQPTISSPSDLKLAEENEPLCGEESRLRLERPHMQCNRRSINDSETAN